MRYLKHINLSKLKKRRLHVNSIDQNLTLYKLYQPLLDGSQPQNIMNYWIFFFSEITGDHLKNN